MSVLPSSGALMEGPTVESGGGADGVEHLRRATRGFAMGPGVHAGGGDV
jgi:hypothetical protein